MVSETASPATIKTVSPTIISPTISTRIKIARVLCILAVIYMHIPPYLIDPPTTAFSSSGIIWMIREIIGRSSVPLLSVVSGYLLVMLAGSKSWTDQVGRKILTVVVPLALWSAVIIAKDAVLSGPATLPDVSAIPQHLFGISGFPRNGPLYFLRDVFVCVLWTPVLLYALERKPWILFALLVANSIFNLDGVIFTNSAIVLFFTIGLAFAKGLGSPDIIDRHSRILAPLSLVILLAIGCLPFYMNYDWIAASENDWALRVLQLADRFAGAILFWCVTKSLLRFPRVVTFITAFEPVIFFTFCGHTLIAGAVWMCFETVGFRIGGAAHLAFFAAAPLIGLAASICGTFVLSLVAPRFLGLLLGGRSPSRAQFWNMLAFGRLAPRPVAAG